MTVDVNKEDERKIENAHRLVREIFPNIIGSFEFHLHPEQKKAIYKLVLHGFVRPKE